MNKRINTIICVLATALFYVCQWQIDLWVAPYLWNDPHVIEVLPFWYMLNTEAYVLFFILLNVAYWIGMVSLWFWED